MARRPCPTACGDVRCWMQPNARKAAGSAARFVRRRRSGFTTASRGSTWAAACSAPSASGPARREPSGSPTNTGWPRRPARHWSPGAEEYRLARGAGREDAADLRPLAEAAAGQRRRLQCAARRTSMCSGTIGFDLGRFGIQFVASPRHADGLLVTGPVTKNMVAACRRPTTRCRRRRSSSPSAPARFPAARSSLIPSKTMASPIGEGGSLYSRLPAAPAHDPRRTASVAGTIGKQFSGKGSSSRYKRQNTNYMMKSELAPLECAVLVHCDECHEQPPALEFLQFVWKTEKFHSIRVNAPEKLLSAGKNSESAAQLISRLTGHL